MAKAKAQAASPIIIPQLKIERLKLKVQSPPGGELIVHAWSAKARKEIGDKIGGKPKQGKEPYNKIYEYGASLYWLTKQKPHELIDPPIQLTEQTPVKHGVFGFKTIAFKAAAVRAANDCGVHMTLARRAFHLLGEFAVLEYKRMYMREDMVVIGNGISTIRHRAAFVDWSAILDIQFNSGIFNKEQIANLFNTAGFGVGVGEWRPERNGVSGRFVVV